MRNPSLKVHRVAFRTRLFLGLAIARVSDCRDCQHLHLVLVAQPDLSSVVVSLGSVRHLRLCA
jgi:hypothetical protein